MSKQLLSLNLLDDLAKQVEELKKCFDDLGKTNYTLEQSKKIFSNYGWYIPFELMIIKVPVLTGQFENNDIQNADKFLIKHFKKNIPFIKETLIKNYPERKDIFIEAFSAHRKKMFFSSTILFLSQADGMTKNKIFMGKKFRDFSKANKDHPLVRLFEKKNPLTKQFNKGEQSEYLNRHSVMHGLSNSYGVELNSYKALSFLWFISNFRNSISE